MSSFANTHTHTQRERERERETVSVVKFGCILIQKGSMVTNTGAL